MQRIRLLCAVFAVATGSVFAADIRVQCYSDGNECEVLGELAKRFESRNAGTKVMIDKVPYKAVVETLPVQLAAGEGPDIARVTDLGGLNKFYLDLTPTLGARANYWEENFVPSLKSLRAGPGDKGIYGRKSQHTVTGAFVNKSLYEQAKVPKPGPTATDWLLPP
jgi:alpha-1,4-digalacturonate transport system substrate-binding protein